MLNQVTLSSLPELLWQQVGSGRQPVYDWMWSLHLAMMSIEHFQQRLSERVVIKDAMEITMRLMRRLREGDNSEMRADEQALIESFDPEYGRFWSIVPASIVPAVSACFQQAIWLIRQHPPFASGPDLFIHNTRDVRYDSHYSPPVLRPDLFRRGFQLTSPLRTALLSQKVGAIRGPSLADAWANRWLLHFLPGWDNDEFVLAFDAGDYEAWFPLCDKLAESDVDAMALVENAKRRITRYSANYPPWHRGYGWPATSPSNVLFPMWRASCDRPLSELIAAWWCVAMPGADLLFVDPTPRERAEGAILGFSTEGNVLGVEEAEGGGHISRDLMSLLEANQYALSPGHSIGHYCIVND